MLDERTEKLLAALGSFCEGSGYAVVTMDDISVLVPEMGLDRSETLRLLERLALNECINLRFAEGGEFCLSVLPKGRAYEQRVSEANKSGCFARYKGLFIATGASFAGAAIGAFLAGLIK